MDEACTGTARLHGEYVLNAVAKFADEYRFLSNFWPSEVTLDGVSYPTVEHAYQAAKSLDPAVRMTIRAESTAGGAKRAGQDPDLTVRDDWEDVKVRVMAGLVAEKFFRYPELADLLRATHDITLIEGNNWHDTFWGCCTCDEHGGAGGNRLGIILMTVRAALIQTAPN